MYIYSQEAGLETYESLEALERRPAGSTLWIDINSDSKELLDSLAIKFDLHELTIEDSLTPDHFPKLENFGKYLFIIFRGLAPSSTEEEEDPEDREHSDEEEFTRQVAMYLSKDYLITVRTQDVPWVDAYLRMVKQNPEQHIAIGADALAHRIIDAGIDRFERGLDAWDEEIDELEETAIDTPDDFEMYHVLDLKRELVALRQIAREQRMIILKLVNESSNIIDPDHRRYFKDIDDHALELINTLDKLIDNLQGVRDAYFAFSNIRLGNIMRILTVITTILAPLNMMVGIYGMNFEVLPLAHDPNGFWIMISLITVAVVVMLTFFRKKRWF